MNISLKHLVIEGNLNEQTLVHNQTLTAMACWIAFNQICKNVYGKILIWAILYTIHLLAIKIFSKINLFTIKLDSEMLIHNRFQKF